MAAYIWRWETTQHKDVREAGEEQHSKLQRTVIVWLCDSSNVLVSLKFWDWTWNALGSSGNKNLKEILSEQNIHFQTWISECDLCQIFTVNVGSVLVPNENLKEILSDSSFFCVIFQRYLYAAIQIALFVIFHCFWIPAFFV